MSVPCSVPCSVACPSQPSFRRAWKAYRRAIAAMLLLGLALAACSSGPDPATPSRRLHILATNDDGIDSERLHALVLELGRLGDVAVVAPDSNRSGVSHGMTAYASPTVVTPRSIPGAYLAQAVAGTPADAVDFALYTCGRERPFDVVVSGVNSGQNVGMTAHASGTVGAAMEAVICGVPGLAVSAARDQRDHALCARVAALFVRELMARGSPEGIGYNINVPAGAAVRDIAVAPMGGNWYRPRGYRLRPAPDPKTGARVYDQESDHGPDGADGCDSRQFAAGRITVTPIRAEWTDPDMLQKIRSWDLRLR